MMRAIWQDGSIATLLALIWELAALQGHLLLVFIGRFVLTVAGLNFASAVVFLAAPASDLGSYSEVGSRSAAEAGVLPVLILGHWHTGGHLTARLPYILAARSINPQGGTPRPRLWGKPWV